MQGVAHTTRGRRLWNDLALGSAPRLR